MAKCAAQPHNPGNRLDIEDDFEQHYRQAEAVANLVGADRGQNILRATTLPAVSGILLEHLDAMDAAFHNLLAIHIGGAR